ncbi:MAG TPA: hypothetical protein VGJ92_04565 [Methanocella sp.]
MTDVKASLVDRSTRLMKKRDFQVEAMKNNISAIPVYLDYCTIAMIGMRGLHF